MKKNNAPLFVNMRNTCVVKITSPQSKEDLYRQLCTALQRPSTSSANWDALCDMLQDMAWISEDTVIFIHDSLAGLGGVERNTYLSILNDMLSWWDNHDEHKVLLILPPECEEEFTGMNNC